MEYVKMSVTVRKDQKEWLEEHPSLNASGMLREKIDEEMKKRG